MTRRHLRRPVLVRGESPVFAWLVLVLLHASPVCGATPPLAEHGVIVESVEPASAGELMGLRVGDRLVSWCVVQPTQPIFEPRGVFESPFDADTFALEIAPRPRVSVVVSRRGTPLRLSVVP